MTPPPCPHCGRDGLSEVVTDGAVWECGDCGRWFRLDAEGGLRFEEIPNEGYCGCCGLKLPDDDLTEDSQDPVGDGGGRESWSTGYHCSSCGHQEVW